MSEFLPGGTLPLGVPIVIYDGTNAQDIVRALYMESGDGIVAIPGKPILMRSSQLDDPKVASNPMKVTPPDRTSSSYCAAGNHDVCHAFGPIRDLMGDWPKCDCDCHTSDEEE